MQKEKIRKIAYSCLFIAVFISTSGGFFAGQNIAEAKKSSVTKWQKKLVQTGVDQALWQKYLPKISRKECNKVTNLWKKMGGAAQTATAVQTEVTAQSSSLGPEIAVGLWYNSKDDIFKINANKTYNIKDKNGGVIAQVAGDSTTRVKYDDDGKLKVYSSIAETLVDDNVTFDAADDNNSDIIFDVHRGTAYVEVHKWDGYDHFRGKINVNYYQGEDIYNKNSSSVTQIWVINKLPLEQYVWGAGETTGTAGSDHARVMTTIFRTYGDWYVESAKNYKMKYESLGFIIRSDAGSQVYVGAYREEKFPKVKEAAEETRGKIITYKGDAILATYCSSTDGWTRPYPYTNRKKKPSKDYPYLKSVKDHKKGTVNGLEPGEGGNHMWGLSGKGAIGYADDGKAWDWILKYYYSGVDIESKY